MRPLPVEDPHDHSGPGRRGMSGSGEDVCAVCQEEPTDARILPCGNRHLFCLQPCLRDLLAHHRQQPGNDRNRFPCPLCRTMVTIPPKGPEAFEPIVHEKAPPGTKMVHQVINVEEQKRLLQDIQKRRRQDGRTPDPSGQPSPQPRRAGQQPRERVDDREGASPGHPHRPQEPRGGQARQPMTGGLRVPLPRREADRSPQRQQPEHQQRPREPRAQALHHIEQERRSLEHRVIAEEFQREEERRMMEQLRIQEQVQREEERRAQEEARLLQLGDDEEQRRQVEERRLLEVHQLEEDRRAAERLQLGEQQRRPRAQEQVEVLALAEQGLRRVENLMQVYEVMEREQRQRVRQHRAREQRRGNSSGVCSVM